MTRRLAIGIDLGGTNIKAALVDRLGRILERAEQSTRAERGPKAVIADLVEIARRWAAPEGVRGARRIAGIGLATPGPLDLVRGRIVHAANLPGWKNVRIRDGLARATALSVILENDANAAAYGEFTAGAGRGCDHVVMLTLGTGVGGGVIIDGRILHGHFDNAAEFGHMIVAVDGLPCPCGQRGCLERYASADAIVRRAAQSRDRRRDRRGSVVPEAPRARGAQGGGADPLRADEIARSAAAGDRSCRRIWDEACLYLAVACVNIQHAFNPQRIILGGGLAGAGSFLLNSVRARFREQTWRLHKDSPQIVLAELGNDAGTIGAAALAHDS